MIVSFKRFLQLDGKSFGGYSETREACWLESEQMLQYPPWSVQVKATVWVWGMQNNSFKYWQRCIQVVKFGGPLQNFWGSSNWYVYKKRITRSFVFIIKDSAWKGVILKRLLFRNVTYSYLRHFSYYLKMKDVIYEESCGATSKSFNKFQP